MNNLITTNVLRHFGAQIGAIAVMGALTAIAHADFSALGVYAPLVSAAVATIMSVVNEALGGAPKK